MANSDELGVNGAIKFIKKRCSMPIIQVQVLEGRNVDQIKGLIVDITEAAVNNLDVRHEQVRVVVTEIPDTNWGAGGSTMKEIKARRQL
ncbi:tautomerase family protein [Sporosarcina sp. NCCP-2331]|uniref:tautomerase family protein n=1 Tax=unclassified Sporosarcina TaxID=2647733 RepID=UPI0035E459E7